MEYKTLHTNMFGELAASAKNTEECLVQMKWLQLWFISISYLQAIGEKKIQYGTLPQYLYLGHCFELWSAFIFPFLSFLFTHSWACTAQMQSMHSLLHVLGPCHRG